MKALKTDGPRKTGKNKTAGNVPKKQSFEKQNSYNRRRSAESFDVEEKVKRKEEDQTESAPD